MANGTIGMSARGRVWDGLCLVLVIAAALVPHLGYVLKGPHAPVQWDQAHYHVCGRYLSGDYEYEEYGRTITAHYMNTKGPLYLLFLGEMYRRFGPDVMPVRIVQAVLGVLTCGCVFLIAWQLGGRTVATVAGLLPALYPPFFSLADRIFTESVATFFLYAGLALLLSVMRTGSVLRLLMASLAVSLAALSRSTFLPLVPFLAISVPLALRQGGLRRRLAHAGVFVAVIGAAMLFWQSLSATTAASERLLGAAGGDYFVRAVTLPTHPSFRGWKPDPGPPHSAGFGDPWWEEASWGYAGAAVLNLVFCHAWFADTGWTGGFFLPQEPQDWLLRVVFVLALGGLGVGLAKWRNWLPLLVLWIPFAVLWVKWIELRHATPAMPLFCIFAVAFIAALCRWVVRQGSPGRALGLLLSLVGATAVIVFAVPVEAARVLSIHPLTLGTARDVLIAVLVCVWAFVIARLARAELGKRLAALAAGVPAVIFLSLFISYIVVGSSARWHRWELNLAGVSEAIVQEIELPAPLDAGSIKSASWLVDARFDSPAPKLDLGVNDEWVTDSGTKGDFEPLLASTATYRRQRLYRLVRNATRQRVENWSQWWRVPVDVSAIAGRKSVSFMLKRAVDGEGGAVYLGGGLAGRKPNQAHMPQMRRSIYRREVLKDWRYHGLETLASVRTRGCFIAPDTGNSYTQTPSGVPAALPRLLDKGHAQANISLLVEFVDGRSVLY